MAARLRGAEDDVVWWVFVALAVLVILAAALVLTGRASASSTDSDAAPAPAPLPSGEWTAADIEGLQFRVGLRGYRMEDVDAALAALAADLRNRETPGSATEPGQPLGQ